MKVLPSTTCGVVAVTRDLRDHGVAGFADFVRKHPRTRVCRSRRNAGDQRLGRSDVTTRLDASTINADALRGEFEQSALTDGVGARGT
jgi:hypothetical protein